MRIKCFTAEAAASSWVGPGCLYRANRAARLQRLGVSGVCLLCRCPPEVAERHLRHTTCEAGGKFRLFLTLVGFRHVYSVCSCLFGSFALVGVEKWVRPARLLHARQLDKLLYSCALTSRVPCVFSCFVFMLMRVVFTRSSCTYDVCYLCFVLLCVDFTRCAAFGFLCFFCPLLVLNFPCFFVCFCVERSLQTRGGDEVHVLFVSAVQPPSDEPYDDMNQDEEATSLFLGLLLGSSTAALLCLLDVSRCAVVYTPPSEGVAWHKRLLIFTCRSGFALFR